MSQRIVVCYNKKSSRFPEISNEVLRPLRTGEFSGSEFELYEFEIKKASVSENARRLSKIVEDGDVVLSAGGDGTATAVLNGVILSRKDVRLAVLPYGNFNDFSRLLKTKKLAQVISGIREEKTKQLYPLEAKINGKHFRYAACYFTLGMFAESTEAFNNARVRKSLVAGRRSLFFSIFTLFSWWRKNRKKQFFPEDFPATDVLAVNGKSVARMMKGSVDLAFSDVGFLASKRKLSGFFAISWFMARSIIYRVPGKVADSIKLGFSKPYEIEIQAEGEYERKKCRKIEITKSAVPVEVIIA